MKVDIGDIVNSLDVGTKGGTSQKVSPVMLMWGIADTSATVGKMFNYAIPDDAFKGTVLKYKVIIYALYEIFPLHYNIHKKGVGWRGATVCFKKKSDVT